MRVLVTGATGFIGSHVAAALVRRGDQVRVLRRKGSSTLALDGLDVEHIHGDILERDSVAAAVHGCDLVFHVAAVASYWRTRSEKVYRVNIQGTRIVLDACLAAGVRRMIYTSSVAALGMPRTGKPADETQILGGVAERWPYAHSKHLAEQEVRAAVAQGLSAVIVNPAIVIGPGDHNLISGSMIVEMAKRTLPLAPPGGVCMADIDAVVQGHLAAAEQGRTGERYILGGENLTYKEITAIIAEVVGRRAPRWTIPAWALPPAATALDMINHFVARPIASGDQMRLSAHNVFFDSSKAMRELDYRILPFRDAAARAYQWYAEHGYLT